jgi:mannitol-1-phosphate 5-dehydrogenase
MRQPDRVYVGFGFGPIQSALFLYEAYRSGNFKRLVVAEVLDETVRAIRESHGRYAINIAGNTRITRHEVTGVEIYNPGNPDDRLAILETLASADEVATCLPSVDLFDVGAATSVARLLAEGLSKHAGAKPVLLYAAENHNHAAEILIEKVSAYLPSLARLPYQALNTVIGKMSGVIADPAQIKALKLATITPTLPKAILVEEFNRILISRVTLPGASRGITAFVEKDDLLPFEEAKLYGHNAVHALIGYLAQLRGLRVMSEAAADPVIMKIARAAFIEESGGALTRRHARLGDPLFTPGGYRAYAEDLLDRMTRATLNDLVARICRDPARKLGYDDRFYGTMRVALEQGIQPVNLAMGAAAALIAHAGPARAGQPLPAADILASLWGSQPSPDADTLVSLTAAGLRDLGKSGFIC